MGLKPPNAFLSPAEPSLGAHRGWIGASSLKPWQRQGCSQSKPEAGLPVAMGQWPRRELFEIHGFSSAREGICTYFCATGGNWGLSKWDKKTAVLGSPSARCWTPGEGDGERERYIYIYKYIYIYMCIYIYISSSYYSYIMLPKWGDDMPVRLDQMHSDALR